MGFQVESELAGLGQADRELFLADMGVSDEECGLQVCVKISKELSSLF